MNSVDLSLFKEIVPLSRLRVQLRVEAFNIFNYVQFGSPNVNINSASVGQVTSQANTPRQLQLGIKALW